MDSVKRPVFTIETKWELRVDSECKSLGHNIESEYVEHFGEEFMGVWYIFWWCLSCGAYGYKKITEKEFVDYHVSKVRK